MRESGLRAQEQIRVKKEAGRVLIQRVPADARVGVGLGGLVWCCGPARGGVEGGQAGACVWRCLLAAREAHEVQSCAQKEYALSVFACAGGT